MDVINVKLCTMAVLIVPGVAKTLMLLTLCILVVSSVNRGLHYVTHSDQLSAAEDCKHPTTYVMFCLTQFKMHTFLS